MLAAVQRVSEASVQIDGRMHASVGKGLLVLLGISDDDGESDAEYLAGKIVRMRIFGDAESKMNLSVSDVEGELLIISQFTLFADTRKGNRPSFIRAARPEKAVPLYEFFIRKCKAELGRPVKTGVFGADMKVGLINDGPVTILIDSKNP